MNGHGTEYFDGELRLNLKNRGNGQSFIISVLLREAHVPYQEKLSFIAPDETFWARLRGGLTQSDLLVFTSLKKKILPTAPLAVH